MSDTSDMTCWHIGQRVLSVRPDNIIPQGTRGTVVSVLPGCPALMVRFDDGRTVCLIGVEEVAAIEDDEPGDR